MNYASPRSVTIYKARRRSFALALSFFCLIFLFCEEAASQFLSRDSYPLWDEAYENYGFMEYRDYEVEQRNSIYDPLGSYLIEGIDIYTLEEYRTRNPLSGSVISKTYYYRDYFNNLVICQDSFHKWSSTLIVGDAIKTYFTPLTINITRLNGIRWDATMRRNKFSFVASRVSKPIVSISLSGIIGEKSFATYLLGGHWQSILGGVLVFGVSYVNLYHVDSMADRKQGSLKGVVPYDLSGYDEVYVILSDDSPEDGVGPELVSISMYVNGEKYPAVPEVKLIRGVDELIRKDRSKENRNQISQFFPSLERRDGPWLLQSVTLGKLLSFKTEASSMPTKVDGGDVLICKYVIPKDARRVSFEAMVSGDYNIDVASRLNMKGITGSTWDDWHNVSRSPGNPKDYSNFDRITFDYSFPTGITLYGADLQANFGGFNVSAEYVRGFSFSKFPSPKGERSKNVTDSYFLRVIRPIGGNKFGFESFYIPPDLPTSLAYFNDYKQKTDNFYLVDDNDDRDEWPDSWEQGKPGSNITIPTPDAMANLDPKPDRAIGGGVYPGLDVDRDGIPDNNANANQIPDYMEPFLSYYTDPDEFIYGDDMNNNGVVDARENDETSDYPYKFDTKGYHMFTEFELRKDIKVRLGHYSVRQESGGGGDRTTYCETSLDWKEDGLGSLGLNYRIKRVHDTIPDDLYEYVVDPLVPGYFSIKVRPDLLQMNNSVVHDAFLETGLKITDEVKLGSSLKYHLNQQRKYLSPDLTMRRGRTFQSWAWIVKSDYTWQRGPLTLRPMLKYSLFKSSTSDRKSPLEQNYHLMPILLVNYELAQGTYIRLGAQGSPFFKEIFRDLTDGSESFNAVNYAVILENTSDYSGHRVNINIGITTNRRDFTDLEELSSFDYTQFFVRARVD